MDPVVIDNAAQLNDVQAQFDTVLRSIGEGIIAIDSRNIIVMTNAQLDQMWGYEPGELVGKPVQILMPRRYRRDHTAGVRHFIMENKQSTSGHWSDVEALRKDGTEFPIHIRISKVQTNARFLLMAAVRDATVYQHARESLAKLAILARENGDSPDLVTTLEELMRVVKKLNLAAE